jgi:lysozyme
MLEIADVSALGGIPSGAALRAAGVAAVLPRVSSGVERDPTAVKALLLGLPAIAGYCYLRSGGDGVAQADVALTTIDDLGLPFLFVDVEPLPKPLPTDHPDHYCGVLLAFLGRCAEHGRRVGLYGGAFLGLLELPQECAELPLWVAHYGVSTPHVPNPWDVWTLWQYKGNVEIGGAKVDMSKAPGMLEDVRRQLDGRVSWIPGAWGLVSVTSEEAAGTCGTPEKFCERLEGPLGPRR